MRLLWKAIDTALLTKATIVTETGHVAGTKERIGREFRPDKYKKRGLYYTEVFTKVPFGYDADEIWETEVDLTCVGETELKCADIQKAVTDLWRGSGNSATFLDITNSDIIC